MTNNNDITAPQVLPWTPPTPAKPRYATDADVINHLRGEGWTTKEIVEFMNETKRQYGGPDRLLTFDQWEDAALAWVA